VFSVALTVRATGNPVVRERPCGRAHMRSQYKLIAEEQLPRYRASLDWYGYSENDFELTEQVDPPPKADARDEWGLVAVTRKSTNTTRYYRAGPSLCWLDAFDDDLKRGVFHRRATGAF